MREAACTSSTRMRADAGSFAFVRWQFELTCVVVEIDVNWCLESSMFPSAWFTQLDHLGQTSSLSSSSMSPM